MHIFEHLQWATTLQLARLTGICVSHFFVVVLEGKNRKILKMRGEARRIRVLSFGKQLPLRFKDNAPFT